MAKNTTKGQKAWAEKQAEGEGNGESKPRNKTACPLTKDEFLEAAEPLEVTIDGNRLIADVKEFSSGSFGWFLNQKFTVMVDGKPVKVQPSINLIVIGSRPAKEE